MCCIALALWSLETPRYFACIVSVSALPTRGREQLPYGDMAPKRKTVKKDEDAKSVQKDGAPILSRVENACLPGPWADLGQGLAGTHGIPVLSGVGTLQPASSVSIKMTDALPQSPSWLVIGLTLHQQPFMAGTLVPSPDILIAGLIAIRTAVVVAVYALRALAEDHTI